MKRTLSFLLTLLMLVTSLPLNALVALAEELTAVATEAEAVSVESFRGKTVSILSHSASTYDGVSNNAEDNSTIGNNDVYYTEGKHGVYREDTWWQQVIDVLDMRLLVNNSWSGSCVLQPRKGEASVTYKDRAVNLHNDHTGEEPDIIWVYIGGNDFAYYKDTYGKAADVDYDALIKANGDGSYTYADPTTTCEAYAITLHKAATRYPEAEIYCLTSTARREVDYTGDSYPDAGQPTEYSAQLWEVAAHFGYPVVDLEKAIPKDVEIFDSLMGDKRAHPNAEGMDRISEELLSVMLGREVTLQEVIGEYEGVTTDHPAAAAITGEAYKATLTPEPGYSNLSVTVTMGGEDITQAVYADGKITVAEVTGDLVITAKADRKPLHFRWEMEGSSLCSVGDDNALTALAGTVTEGVIAGGRYQAAIPMVLKHDRPWVLEWKCGGDWRGAILTSAPITATVGKYYLSRTKGGQLCFGAWSGSQYDNYGVDLSALNAETHTFRLENRISADGSNMIYLSLDGGEALPMNNYFVGSKAQNTTSDWVSGKDFSFGYLGTDSAPLNDCKLEYLLVCEDTSLSLSYDDRYDVTGKEVEIIDAGVPTSYQVGYGVAEGTLDTAVVTLDGDKLIATGIGTAKVKIDGVTYTVTVKAAPISLIMITGHSMGAGQKGSATQSVICPEGQVYSSHGTTNLGSSTTGVGISYAALTKAKNVNAFTLAGEGTIGEGSALAWEYNKLTGEKVWVLNTAVGGSNLSEWIPGTTNYKNAVAQFRRAQAILSNEIRAGHYTLSDMGILYHNGANFGYKGTVFTQQDLQNWYDAMWNGFKTEFSTDLDGNGTNETASFLGLIPIWTKSGGVSYTEDEPAGLFMAASDEYPDIFTASVIGRDWLTNANVAAKFPEITYTTQDETVILRPTTTAEVFSSDNVHYLQVGYNAVGIDIARNIVDYLNGTDDLPKVTILASDGKTAAADEIELSYNTPLLLTPVVEPITVSDLTFEVSGCVSLSYPLQVTATENGEGSLTVSHNGKVLKKILFTCKDAPVTPLSLSYDDRYDVTGKEVEIIDAGVPTSYQVGYGVAEGTLDTAVVTLDGDKLIATGIGTAKVKIDGVTYTVTVKAAPISLLLLIGQSNAEGMVGVANQSIACENGQVYSTYAKANGLVGDAGLTVENARNYVPSALTGTYSTVNINGNNTKLGEYPVNSLTEAGNGKYGMDSGLAYEWVKQTGEKVWVINAAHGASSISSWQKGQSNFEEAVALFSACEEVLLKEIAAGHYTFSRMGYYWCQGCADETRTAEWYVERYTAMHDALKEALAFDATINDSTDKVTFEFGNIILVMAGHENAVGYRHGTYEDSSEAFFATFKELEMRGPRVAQIWMANNPELEDIHIVSTIAQDWVTMPDGSDGVAEYFATHYENGTIDYPTQTKQGDAWYKPTAPAEVKDSIHYYQKGYNEVGREAVRNTMYILGLKEKPDVQTRVEFVDWTGYKNVTQIISSNVANSETLVVPVVYPCYESKSVTYTLSEGTQYHYYDLTVSGFRGGTLSASVGGKTVSVAGKESYNSYRFELKDNELVSVSGAGFTENTLKQAVSTQQVYKLAENIILQHDKEWRVDFYAEDATRFMALSTTSSSTAGQFYIFKSQSGTGVLSVGEYKDGKYQNYGVLQSQVKIDWAKPHVYSFRNAVAEDGTNTIGIYIDDVWVSSTTTLIIDSAIQNQNNRYLSGKDFVFPYIGASGFALGNNQILWMEIHEDASLSLSYDDRYDVAGKEVEIIDAGVPTSYQVGYGVAEGTLDTAVVTLDGDKLIATGIGTAKVKIDGVTYTVTVKAAPISLLLLIGQSNMRGSEGDPNQSIVCPDGMVYSTYGDDRGESNPAMTVNNATSFAPSALTGAGSLLNVNGNTDCLGGYPLNSLTADGAGRMGPDSGFAYEWVKQTGEKVWVVNAAHGGTSITTWQKGKANYEEALLLFGACQETLRKEIAAGHYTLSHMGYFWCQGCSDRTQTAKWYVEKYLAMHENLKKDLAFDEDTTFEFGGIIPVRVGSTAACYRDGVQTETNSYAYHESFVDLRMNGPRVAQYWMINNPALSDIWGVCNIGDDWVWMPDGTNGVEAYFNAHYENGRVDYTTQVAQKDSWYTPTTPKAVHDSIHYNQIGYNEIGRESVRNALILLGVLEAPEVEPTVEFVSWDGFTPVESINANTTPGSETLVVPLVSPVWKSKEVTYSLSDSLTWEYYDLLAVSDTQSGTLSSPYTNQTVTVSGHAWSAWETVFKPTPEGAGQEKRVCADCGLIQTRVLKGVWQLYDLASHMQTMPEEYCKDTNLWAVLEHDPYYFANGTKWGIYSSGEVPSVTIPVEPGDKIFATSFGKAGENGHATSNGIRVTFFGEYGVVKTMDPAGTYKEFSANGGYLIAPEGAIAINVAMWNGSDDNELYVLNRDHVYENGTCVGCGQLYPNLSSFEGKVISILSASTSTFEGYTPVADGFNLDHRDRYPQDNLLTHVNDTWWMQTIHELNAKLGINDSWAGSQVLNTLDANSGDLGPDAAMASITRIKNLGANGTPDVILFFGGGNDMGRGVALGSFDPATAPTEVDLTATKWESFADAYVAAIMRLQYFYPEAKILAMTSYPMPSYVTQAKLDQYGPVVQAICEHYGVEYLSLQDCGVTFEMLPDNIHPNAEGMDYITAAVVEKLTDTFVLPAGETVAHTVTHNLTEAKASLGYYKGISAGKSFEETLTGEDLAVTVTMGGVDITETAYKNGVISIPAVTGDLVITAKGKFTADGHLQQLPEVYCPATNLWQALTPENIYYTVDGWGNTSAGTTWSITFPVKEGDRIWATSLGAYPDNGSTANGVRITWFDENGVLQTLSRDVVYAEFAKNGYVTAPAGAVALNVPMTGNQAHYAVYILSAEHKYQNSICTVCGEKASPYLQQLPENIIGCTNLYDLLTPVKGYYTATKYDTTNGDVLSVVIPVEPGDRISASSFGSVSENMGSANGIRVTYLLDGVIVESLSASSVYTAYTQDGYLTVPEGVNMVCVPWWKPSENNWLNLSQISKDYEIHKPKNVPAQAPTCTEIGYTAGEICEICNASIGTREEIPAVGHKFVENFCTVCGAFDISAFLSGKYVSILGDSISTFNGYSNDGTVNTTIGANGPRYDVGTADTKPGSYCLLESVDDTWWMHFANRNSMHLLVNNSWAGSQVFGGKTTDGRVIPAAYLERCVNLHDNTLENNPNNAPIVPDVIFVYLGINDYNFNRTSVGSGTVDYAKLIGSDGTYVTPATFGEAYGILLHKMKTAYPEAQIFAMTLLPENLYSIDMAAWEMHNAYIRAAADYYGIPVVDLAENCAITWENYSGYMMDKIHPTTAGMKLISDCIQAELTAYYTENPPHIHSYTATVTKPTCTEKGYTTYTCACGESYVADEVAATGHSYTATVTKPTATTQGYTTYACVCGDSYVDDYVDVRPLNILMIGNSFSWDAADFWYDMQTSMTYDAMKAMLADGYDVHLAVMYKGSATLGYHATCAENNTGAYTFQEIGPETNYVWQPSDGQNATNTILEHLQERDWDIIVIQSYQHEADGTEPRSTYTGGNSKFESPAASLGFLLDYFGQHEPDAKVYYYMPWSSVKFYGAEGTKAGFEAIGKYTKEQIIHMTGASGETKLHGIIPVGTAIENARTTYLHALRYSAGTGATALLKDPQIGLLYDTQHLSFGIGRYIAGLTVAQCLIPAEMQKENISWPSVKDSPSVGILPEEYTLIARKAVENALQNPYGITAINGYDTDPADKLCEEIASADYTGTGLTDEASVRAHLKEKIEALLGSRKGVDIQITIHSYSLESGTLWNLEAEATVRVGYTTRTAKLIVTEGTKHQFGEWIHVNPPTPDSLGVDQAVCAKCGYVLTKEVEGSWQKYDLADHLQALPDSFCSQTNLWSLLNPESVMIDHLGNWVSAGTKVYSVTIPVNPGDRIYANSFGLTGNTKGIQVSFIGVYGIVQTTFSAQTYQAFTENGGYLIAPEGAIAVNIPVWNYQSADNTIHILGREHSYTATVTPPTCTEKGYTTYTCSCGHSYVDTYTEAAGHSFGVWETVKAPAEGIDGILERECKNCDAKETVNLSSHFSHLTYVAFGDSITYGIDGVDWGLMAHPYPNLVTETLGFHKLVNKAVSGATFCENSLGRKNMTQVILSYTGEADVISLMLGVNDFYADLPLGTAESRDNTTVYGSLHLISQYLTTHYADSFIFYMTPFPAKKGPYANGQGYKLEDVANAIKEVAAEYGIPVLDTFTLSGYEKVEMNSPNSDGVHPSQSFTKEYAAPMIVKFIAENYNAKHPHHEVILPGVTPTCTASGLSEGKVCTVCGEVLVAQEVLPATGHSYKAVVTKPTCTAEGYTTYTCHCGDSYVADKIPALGHSFGQWYTTKEATCTADGEQRRECANCDAYETKVITATGHSYQATVTKPTCTTEGCTTYTCHCGDSYVADKIPATGHSFGQWETVKNATCTADGEQRRDCANCDAHETKVITATGHDYGAWYTVKEAACMENGLEQRDCKNCNHFETNLLPATGHSYTSVVTKPTCTEGGFTTYTCKCGASYVANRTPATGHSYTAVVTKPTCTEQGFTTYTCHCGDSYVADKIPATGHTFGQWETVKEATCTENGEQRRECANCDVYETKVVEAIGHSYTAVVTKPTCTEGGFTTYTCHCGDSYVADKTPATGHSYGEWYTVKEATCLTEGSQRRDCLHCNSFEVQILPATGHIYGDWYAVKESACTENGLERRDCKNCNHFETQIVPATGHVYEGVTTKPTCTTEGFTTYTCKCGASYVAGRTPATGHSYTAVVTKPTCTTGGYTTYTCHCGDSYVAGHTDPTGHIWDDGVVTVEPTEETTGTKLFTCTVCGEINTVTLPTLEHIHSYEGVVTEPTCTEEGYTTYTCRCGDYYVADRTPALGHSYESVLTQPTCTEKGYYTYTCTLCGDYYVGNYIPATGHAWDDGVVTVEPTEETTGTKIFTCTVCGEINTVTLPTLEHIHKYEGVVTKPTCTTEGYTTYTCRCGDYYVADKVPALGHSYNAVVTEPTCTEEGYTTYTCVTCGDSYVSDYVDPAGHTWGEWQDVAPGKEERSCTACGEVESRDKIPDYDVDGNGTIDQADVELLMSILVGNTQTETLYDFDFDGVLTIYDCVLLTQQIA